ncbi:unnamed protein product [Spirodela intermedia]|uniref:Inhibitor I9 domain-containing protein n=2 Tax=Spirodela intermedia TaxID=51605 RepID=A0A7I8J397_SPIIN|nr:unnamed protein product [Spirodela intermedia]CAA6663820.1 unnamed protein product [Spirodela intermedia]CAA7400318.1 unnamed protein product [Spirodela intermedia]
MRSIFFFVCCCLALAGASATSTLMAETEGEKIAVPTEVAAIHIVYTERPEDDDPEAYHVKTLTSVLGSEEAAREALVYSYKTAVSGFSAKLTPQQVAEISKQPGVLHVAPSRTLQLHPGTGRPHRM